MGLGPIKARRPASGRSLRSVRAGQSGRGGDSGQMEVSGEYPILIPRAVTLGRVGVEAGRAETPAGDRRRLRWRRILREVCGGDSGLFRLLLLGDLSIFTSILDASMLAVLGLVPEYIESICMR